MTPLRFAFTLILSLAAVSGLLQAVRPAAAAQAVCALTVDQVVPASDGLAHVRLASNAAVTRDLTLSLFTAYARYGAIVRAPEFHSVGVALPPRGTPSYPVQRLESETLSFKLPSADNLIGARVESDGSCAPILTFTPVVQHIFGFHPRPDDAALVSSARGPIATVLAESLPAPNCGAPYAGARIARVTLPDYPQMAADQGARGAALIVVGLDADGALQSSRLQRSTGNQFLDRSALAAVNQTRYESAVFRCEHIASELILRADFVQGPTINPTTQLVAE